jgi:shikimate kinase
MTKNNLILIGMPGAGKSTVGVILAKRIGFNFIDTDLVIQSNIKCRLQEIINTQGLKKFQEIEEQVLLNLDTVNSVIATGGSAVYCPRGLEKLGKTGQIIYIQVPLEALKKRIDDMGQRGLVMAQGQTFEQLYQERIHLYESFADRTVPCENLTAEQVAATIEKII